MKVTNLETNEVGGLEMLREELARVWDQNNDRVISAVENGQSYEDHWEHSDIQGWHSKGVYVTPFDGSKMSVEVHWSFKPSVLPGESYGGCDLELEIVA